MIQKEDFSRSFDVQPTEPRINESKPLQRIRAPTRQQPSHGSSSSPTPEPLRLSSSMLSSSSNIERELQKWREFGSLMATQYEELKEKHAEALRQRAADQSLIASLRGQLKDQHCSLQTEVDSLQNQLSAAQGRIASLEEQVSVQKAAPVPDPRVHELASQVIQLRTDLDKTVAELSRAKRKSLNDSLTGLVMRNARIDSRRGSRSSVDNL